MRLLGKLRPGREEFVTPIRQGFKILLGTLAVGRDSKAMAVDSFVNHAARIPGRQGMKLQILDLVGDFTAPHRAFSAHENFDGRISNRHDW